MATEHNGAYRPGVGMIVLNPAGHILIAKRIDQTAEAWQMPQGGIDAGETPLEAALRELAEETGIDKAEVIAESPDWYYYDLPPALRSILWGGKYVGQKQKWFLMRFTGTDADINLETETPEFIAWKWAEPAQVPELIVPFKKHLYQTLMADFAPLIHSARLG